MQRLLHNATVVFCCIKLQWLPSDGARCNLARRKDLYLKKHPETKQGAKGGWHNNKTDKLETENISVSSFATDAATKTGKTERTIRNKTRIGETLAPLADQIKGTPIEELQWVQADGGGCN